MKSNYGVVIIRNIRNNLVTKKGDEKYEFFENDDCENDNDREHIENAFVKYKDSNSYNECNGDIEDNNSVDNKEKESLIKLDNKKYNSNSQNETNFTNANANTNDNANTNTNTNKTEEFNIILKNRNSWKLNNSYSFFFPIAYFITSITSIFILILLNCIKNGIKDNISANRFALHPFPAFYTMNSVQPLIYSFSILALALIGLINVWFYCSMLLQRFSVPELQSKKIGIHLMFILGILANIIYLFFGFSHNVLKIEPIQIKEIKVSLMTVIYLTFIFFNILFGVLTVLSLEALLKQTEDYFTAKNESKDKKNLKEKIQNNIRLKKSAIYLGVFVMLIYIGGIALRDHEQINENHHRTKSQFEFILEIVLFILPYILFIGNAFLNLSYYTDILYVQDNLMTIIDKEYFETGPGDNTFTFLVIK